MICPSPFLYVGPRGAVRPGGGNPPQLAGPAWGPAWAGVPRILGTLTMRMPGAQEPCLVVASHEKMISAMSCCPLRSRSCTASIRTAAVRTHVAPAALQITKQPGSIDHIGEFEALLNQRSAGARARRPGTGAGQRAGSRRPSGRADLVRHGRGATGSAAVTLRRRCVCICAVNSPRRSRGAKGR